MKGNFKAVERYSRTRAAATGPGSMQKKYVNVASGSSIEPELDEIVATLLARIAALEGQLAAGASPTGAAASPVLDRFF